MYVVSSNEIKKEIINNIEKGIKKFEEKNIKNKEKNNTKNKITLLIISQGKDQSVLKYKEAIIKRCLSFNIDVLDKNFEEKENHIDILDSVKNLKNINGFIILQPIIKNVDIAYLRENMPYTDLDGFKYETMGKILDKDFSNMPQTARACIKFLEHMKIDLSSKDIIIANSNNIIGKPLLNYLNAKKATVTLFNSKTINQEEKIKNADIFISAIGKPNYYNKKYFKDGQILIDVGTSFLDGKMYGDIDYEEIEDMDLTVVKSRNGVGSITTLCLIESLVKSAMLN